MFLPPTLLLALTVQAADTGAVLYAKWCSACHGADARGGSLAMTRLEVPAANLADCKVSSTEPEALWVAITRDGGAAYGLSIDMPAFAGGAFRVQIEWIVRYLKSLCTVRAWPPGELNFPRAFLAEKAFPENEIVVVAHGREQEFIYERRFGPRLQLEAAARTVMDGGDLFDGVTAAVKYNAWHNLSRLMLASVGLEVTPPIGRQADWEFEPFVSFGASSGDGFVLQGEVVAVIEGSFAGAAISAGLGREMGRFVPMLEARWTIPRVGQSGLALAPQVWVQLSRLGHVAASVGLDLPVAGPGPRDARLIAFVLWDFGDGGLTTGW